MYVSQRDFSEPKTQTRHFRLFELMRQSNVCAGTNRKAPESTESDMAAFRDMACASLRF